MSLTFRVEVRCNRSNMTDTTKTQTEISVPVTAQLVTGKYSNLFPRLSHHHNPIASITG